MPVAARAAEEVVPVTSAAADTRALTGAARVMEAVATLRPGEVDTPAPLGGVTALLHAADISARWEERMARPAVVLRTCHAGPDTERPGEPAVGHTASGQWAVMPPTARTAVEVVPVTSAAGDTGVLTGPAQAMEARGILPSDIPASVMVRVRLVAVRTDLVPVDVTVLVTAPATVSGTALDTALGMGTDTATVTDTMVTILTGTTA